ncbi:L-arabinose isomerase [Streptomyces sp. NPDC050549]|uniref:L-arabinose isomerase n=1 Tax=Streptomyces sp. NPDC050549 TaxID=3155406 RepID=UPI003417A71A
MTAPNETYPAQEIWFLTGSQDLYGDATLSQVADQSRRIADILDSHSEIRARIVWKPVLTDSESIRRLCQEANASADCTGLIVWMHTFSPAKMWIAGLSVLDRPLLHLHTQFNLSLPWSSIDMDFMNLNQAAHGDREFAHVGARLGVSRKIVAGHATDPRVIERIAAWSRAAAGRQASRTLRLARFGDNMRDVAVTEGDKVEAERVFGFSVNSYAVNDLVAVVDSVPDKEVAELAADYGELYDLVPILRPDGPRHDSLLYAARLELGLRTFLTEGGFTAFTTNFEDLGGLRQLPGIAVQRLMADGYGFGAEGDWKTSALLRTIKVMGLGQPGGTTFMEDYTYHLGPGTPRILGAHMLEVCPSVAAARPHCEIHPLSIGGREDPVRLIFDAAPGPALVVGLCDLGDRFRLTANAVDVVAPSEPLPHLPVARAVWKPRPSLAESAESWLLAGAPHHTVLSSAVDIEALNDYAAMTDVELLTIDENTTVNQLAKEIRWNSAYYRLAQAL